MKYQRYIVLFFVLFSILIGLHGYLIFRLLPILDNIDKVTSRLNKDYDPIYNQVMDILNNTKVYLNMINNSTNEFITSGNRTLNNLEITLGNLNNTITNLNNTVNNLEENLKIDF